jgi:AsmA protein
MRLTARKILIKVLKIAGVAILSLLLLMFLLPILFPDFVAKKLKHGQMK